MFCVLCIVYCVLYVLCICLCRLGDCARVAEYGQDEVQQRSLPGGFGGLQFGLWLSRHFCQGRRWELRPALRSPQAQRPGPLVACSIQVPLKILSFFHPFSVYLVCVIELSNLSSLLADRNALAKMLEPDPNMRYNNAYDAWQDMVQVKNCMVAFPAPVPPQQ